MAQGITSDGAKLPHGIDQQASGSRSIPFSCAPVAIVGMGFRLPGDLGNESELWAALKAGRDLVTEVPADRWATDELQHPTRAEPGRSITFAAGVLSRADQFDAEFFGISPREAAWMDPQQRLLLELTWEALEHAGVPPASLAGSDCAVYVGISSLDYGTRVLDDLSSLGGHMMTGNTMSVAANRISYVFDLHGPSLAVDTACSSSLVALHHACVALQTGQASTALVGGVNMLMHPYPFVGFTKAAMLSGDGRSKAFDESGDGYVRAEGGAVLLLKPLAQAEADGDEILAVIRASGVNADGSRKTGITIPSRDGQVELMRSVLARSGLAAGDIDFVEAHGTGTSVGDPIEAAAIGAVYGAGAGREQPLPIGSVKANLGHLEAASGMAGLVKTVIALRQRALPASLHLDTPNPRIDFAGLKLALLTEYTELTPRNGRTLVAGLNSFGFGGANAHVLLEAGPRRATGAAVASPASRGLPPLYLSARTDEALRQLAARYARWLDQEVADECCYDIAYASATGRQRLARRLVCRAATRIELVAALQAFAEGRTVSTIVCEDAPAEAGDIAFVYSGNGAQWIGMGRRLCEEVPRFRQIITDLDARMQALLGYSILAELYANGAQARLDDTEVAQPLLFAVQVGATLLLREQGVEPAAVTGHSVGEVAAAWACGALSLDQALQVVVMRSAAQGKTRGTGRMAAVALGQQEAQEAIAAIGGDDVVVAGINSPGNVTLSGSLEQLRRIEAWLRPRGVFFRLLDLDYAFHSHAMDPVQELLTESLRSLQPGASDLALFVSTVSGEELQGAQLDADYWWRNVRAPVLFDQAIRVLAQRHCRVFIEIGPHAILQRYIAESLQGAGVKGKVLPFLRRQNDGVDCLMETVARAELLARSPKLQHHFPQPGRPVHLPSYPWQHVRHWHPSTSEGRRANTSRREHPLLGWSLYDGHVWENVLDASILPWLKDHQVGGAVVFPGAGYTEMALAAARQWLGARGARHYLLEELDILAPMLFDQDQARTLRLSLNERDGSFVIKSKPRLSDDEWTLHASGRILSPGKGSRASTIAVPANGSVIEAGQHYAFTAAVGLEYGPAFRGFSQARLAGHYMELSLCVPDALQASLSDYLLHPALLDVCFQALVGFFGEEIRAARGRAFLPVKTGRIEVFAAHRPQRARLHLKRVSTRAALADIELHDAAGELVARLNDCRFRAAPLVQGTGGAVSLWQTTARLAPRADGADQALMQPSLAVTTLAAGIRQTLAQLATRRHSWFNENLPLQEALVMAFLYEAVRDVVDPVVLESSSYGRWVHQVLKAEGLLNRVGQAWQLTTDPGLPPAAEIWKLLLIQSPQSLPQLLLAGRVGLHLPALLADPSRHESFWVQLVHMPAVETQLDSDPLYAGTTRAIEQLLSDLARDWPPQAALRILEISVGYSDVAHRFVQSQAEGRLQYTLALADEQAMQRHQADLSGQPGLSLAWLDADWNLQSESALPQAYDVVLLRHSLNLAAQPQQVLEKLRGQMASAGLLVVAERHPDLSADFIEGLRPRWWHAAAEQADAARAPLSSLTSPTEWETFLTRAGLSDVECLSEPEAAGRAAYLLLARHAAPAAQPVSPLAGPARRWLLWFDDASALMTEHLRACLIARGQQVDCTTDLERVLHNDADHVVYLRGWAGNIDTAGCRVSELLDVTPSLMRAVHVPRLWVVTRGGALAQGLPAQYLHNPAQAAVWGAMRVAMNEYPDLQITLLDTDSGADQQEDGARLVQELLAPDGINEILLSGAARRSLRWEPREPGGTIASPSSREQRFRLDFKVPGQLRNLQWFALPLQPLADDQIEVRTMAAGLNFRDVMYLMGLLPDEAVENGFAGASLGLEFAGVVTRVGVAVTDLQVGDEVMGFGSACFSSHIVTRRDAVARKPAHWSFESAATVPTVFFTVYYALRHLADLAEGERVLIHGGAGGVGIAAIQLARHLGAEVFATAGSEEKRDFVRLLGADHVFDSRSLDFVDDIMAATGGEGVDVVLNSLAGEAVRRNFSVLKPFGRFLELGKRDFFENTPIGLRPFKDNISYFGIDADQLLTGRARLSGRLFAELMALFDEAVLAPLPYRSFAVPHIVDAFRTMQQARHIGKVVVTLDQVPARIEPDGATQPPLQTDATWLVTGGLSGFGLASAQWLAQQGVGNLVLVSRRGVATPGAPEAIAALQAQGTQVHAVACDITDRHALTALVDQIGRTMPPLKGVLHAAMVIDDRLIGKLDTAAIEAVLQPKLQGAWHLHEVTAGLPLEHFVLYSSITTSIGNPGQANYVAANAGLESLAGLRHRLGLPATCIGWGPIADTGYLTRNTAVRDALEQRLGRPPLSARQALDTLGHLLATEGLGTTLAAANFEWPTLSRLLAPATRFAALEAVRATRTDVRDDSDFRSMVAGKSGPEIFQLVSQQVAREVSAILGVSEERIGHEQSLHDLGLDSLMAVELAMGLERRVGVQLPVMMLNDAPTIAKVAGKIAARLGGEDASEDASGTDTLVEDFIRKHGEEVSAEDRARMSAETQRMKAQGARLTT
ncbi:SDR family NAD(P)-dependent oxidoreductase [Herbaspirillum sp.]|uniref:SDR family NAD(P)-dependent oxidoreductase n=1 Tax=Herbaspirillum sp. TaxID=1890675 RepID=UPI0031E36ACC